MSNGDDRFNDFPPESDEQLSPPLVSHPLYECADTVHVHGFTPGATVRVYANRTELVAEQQCHFSSAKIRLQRSLDRGDTITATQTVNSITSVHTLHPVTVESLRDRDILTDPPTVSEEIYECGHVVPVTDLTPSVRVNVADSNGVIGSASTGDGGWEPVVTSQLHASQQVRAREIACEEDPDRRLEGPWSHPETVRTAPDPVPSPTIEKGSLIVGNDTVTLGNCLPGARVTIKDGNTTISSGWLATGGRTWFPIDPPLRANATITATQELCGNESQPDKATPTRELAAPEVVEPLCDGGQYVIIRDTVVNATVVVFKNNTIIGYGGAGTGDVVLALGSGQQLSQGDDISALQYMGPTVSPRSNTVTVGSRIAAQPTVEIFGGEPFFNAETAAGEEQIDGPVFPRGRGTGPRLTINSCCPEDIDVTIEGPDEHVIAELTPNEVFPGYHTAEWNWTSPSNWDDPSEIPIGEYRVHVRTECDQDDVRVPFYVIFDPAEVGGPPRFSFNETAVWFGTGTNRTHGILYHLHPDDNRIFSKALTAASGETSINDAARKIAIAEQQLFSYSLSYHTDDVLEMLQNHTEAQCADDAGVLTALLRAVGIPAHPVTADAALEEEDAYWTFDTWVEFHSPQPDGPEWMVLHPHEDISTPTTRRTFGTTQGVATKSFNDIIVMADVNWDWNEASDWNSDVTYDRNSCGEPKANLQKAPWVRELCEIYWTEPHWACPWDRTALRAPDGFRFDWDIEDLDRRDDDLFDDRRRTDFEFERNGQPQLGESITGSLPIRNESRQSIGGKVTIELVSHRPESKRFAEETFDVNAQRMRFDPWTEHTFEFSVDMPDQIAPGRQLYLRARLDEQTIALHEVELSTALDSRLELRREQTVGDEFTITAVVHNASRRQVSDVQVTLDTPFFVEVEDELSRSLDDLVPETEHTIAWTARALGAMEAGTITVNVQSEIGGSSQTRSPLRIHGDDPELPGDIGAALSVDEEDREAN